MMDLFGRKRIAQLREDLAQADETNNAFGRKIAQLESTELQLMGQIREMDQLIYRMSQCTSWESMRPIFNELQHPAERRMRKESNRITDVLIPEMKKAYRAEDQALQRKLGK